MLVEFNDVSLVENIGTYQEKVLFNHIHFKCLPNEVTLIKGDSAIYKIGRLILNFIKPTLGQVIVGDYHLSSNTLIKDIKNYRANIGYLPYEYDEMFNYEQVNNILKEALYQYDFKTEDASLLAQDILNEVGLYIDFTKHSLKEFKSIDRYRLFLASILIYDPQVVILEQVIFDYKIKELIEKLKSKNKTVILIGNYNVECDKTFVVSDGLVREVKSEAK